MNYANYYVNQAGNGISGFEGVRFQKGAGFFGLIKSAFLPILKYLGPKLLSTGSAIANDIIAGENFKDSFKNQGKKQAQMIAGDISERAQRFAQTGKGRRKRKKKSAFKSKPKSKRISKRRVKRRLSSKKKKHFTTIF
jgi:hypothetical protein